MDYRIEQPSTMLMKPTRVSPRSFKRQIEIVLEALSTLRMRATIFAKLPQGASWLADLKQYSQTVQPSPNLYLFSRSVQPTPDWYHSILIPNLFPMQGEYFLLAVSETIRFLIQGQREEITVPVHDDSQDETAEEETENLLRVSYRITFQRSLIQNFVADLESALQASSEEYLDQPFLNDLLSDWEGAVPLPEHCHPALVDAILLHAATYQDQIQQQARAYRRQAMTASSLSTQNESLMNTIRLKDNFLSTVGQELRTPLSTIKTALPLLSSPSLKPTQRQRYLDMISRECDRQVNLINGVLELLQIEHSVMTARAESVNIFDVLPGVVSTYQPLAQEKGIRLAYTVPNTLPSVCCPETWVRQIMIHLLSNSIRFTEPGGEVWVTAQTSGEEGLTVQIKDTGIGIPQHELPHVFKHFYRGRQANPDDGGVGLGLAIVQQLLLYCDGRISVESQPDVGTQFDVTLPLHQP